MGGPSGAIIRKFPEPSVLRFVSFLRAAVGGKEFRMETTMFTRTTKILAAAIFALGASTAVAQADACSGHGHATGTVLGAVGGGAIGSAASHGSLGGVVAGAVLGGLAGNAISRDVDCHGGRYHHSRYERDRYYYRHGHRYARW